MPKDRLVRNYPSTCNTCGAPMLGRRSFRCAACAVSPEERAYRREYMRKYREGKTAEPRTPEQRASATERMQTMRIKRKAELKIYRDAVRLEALHAYGGKCECCGETAPQFLEIDHIDGGGGRHRREEHIGNMAAWLKSKGWPTGYRVLCGNCHGAITHHLSCPHVKSQHIESK